jgi:GNAT superfamily N-acetyltransferase
MTEADIQALVTMGSRAHSESEYRKMSFNPDKCERLGQAMYSLSNLKCFVVEQYNKIIAFLMASVEEGYFTDEKTSTDLLVYVLPEWRGSRAFYLLVRAYIGWAKEQGAKLVFLSSSTGYDPEKITSLYTRLGFHRVGGIFQMEV